MQVRAFTYERSWYGTYHRQRIFSMQRMDTHVATMLGDGWEILTQSAHSGQGRSFQPFAKRDIITISFKKAGRFVPENKKPTVFPNDRRRKHRHWVTTLFYADGEKFERVYVDREKAQRFAERQKKSPIVLRARVTEQV